MSYLVVYASTIFHFNNCIPFHLNDHTMYDSYMCAFVGPCLLGEDYAFTWILMGYK